MKLTVVGCSGSVSGPESASSCYLLQAEDRGTITSVVLDLGSGAFGQLLRFVDPGTLDGVLLSHLHADHVVDTAALEVHLKYAPTGPYAPMRVFGPQGTSERLAQIAGDDGAESPFQVEAWRPGERVRLGSLTIEPFPVLHPVPAFALRITGPGERAGTTRVLTFTGDTDLCEGVSRASDGADLLLAEAAFEEGRDHVRGIHLTGRRAGELASGSGARRLVLTHIPPWTNPATVRAEACTTFSGPVDLAAPGACWSL
ncbi:MBL fold metallo-hydrolase [Pseudactinotalea sp. HY160]|uniref:MBL fold metallo-hydrolase n=1 Tax=Pseudactinotalea sp. HY160 TaxID=2654490 RepID=UPI00128DCE13|nr:MBL fold metallo-hydrolase [Pseudactinotalea sp. HY160]MPV50209.1 MBL fold metallo-hydrolase [Pseudactinotalea sp. HY160]